jgi:molecular chaperone GrpE (heat shock protein)
VLFSILNAIEESGKLNENYKNYQAINEQLKSALDINGIEIFIPQLNQDYTKSKGVSSENVIKSETDDPKLVNKIIQVVKPGYILISNGKILRNAQVKIYVTNNKGVLNG